MRIRQLTFVAIAALCVTACDSKINTAKELVANGMRDPAGTQFRNVERCPADPDIITGEANGKNAFGAYVGFSYFYVEGYTVYHLEDMGFSEMIERCYKSNP